MSDATCKVCGHVIQPGDDLPVLHAKLMQGAAFSCPTEVKPLIDVVFSCPACDEPMYAFIPFDELDFPNEPQEANDEI